jgi:metal-responsive CopG/Arc/MetJ family transcriptional regulator
VGRYKTVTVKLDQDLAMEFYMIVHMKGRTVSEVLRELVRKYVEQERFKYVDWEPKTPRKIKVY